MTDRAGNRLSAALDRGECRIGCWLGLDSPAAAEIAAIAGFDWALIDLEHGEGDLRSALAIARALAGTPCDAALRLPSHDPAGIARALDAGIKSLMLPRVESVAQARAISEAALYPPRGRRGMGGAVIRASDYGARAEYTAEADADLLLILQLESRQALEALEEIAAVDGVGALFIGAADLSADMGLGGEASHPAVVREVERSVARIRDAGLHAGVIDLSHGACERWEAQGVGLLATASDVVMLLGALRDKRG